ncbi:hypothetical protein QE152_g23237 [Popillia japonica]|uniref:Uncharacterized protein n=1 Tax=Popillia japonica TaxID=7064 RepID=A0AAW1KHM4_POPJA
MVGGSNIHSNQGPILYWETDLQELFDATTETAERSSREENSRLILNFLREFRAPRVPNTYKTTRTTITLSQPTDATTRIRTYFNGISNMSNPPTSHINDTITGKYQQLKNALVNIVSIINELPVNDNIPR